MTKPSKNKSEREKRLKGFGELARELAPSPEVSMGLEERLDALSGLITKVGTESANSNNTIKSQIEIVAQMISETNGKFDIQIQNIAKMISEANGKIDVKISSAIQDIGALTTTVIDLQNANAEIIEKMNAIRKEVYAGFNMIAEKCKGTTFGEPEPAFKEPTPAPVKETTLYDHIDMKINLTEEEAEALTKLICGNRNGVETQERIKYILTTSMHVQKNSAGMKHVVIYPAPKINGLKGMPMSAVYQLHRELRNAILLNKDFHMRVMSR